MRKGRAASKAASEKITNNVKVIDDHAIMIKWRCITSLNNIDRSSRMTKINGGGHVFTLLTQELSNLGAKKRRPDEEENKKTSVEKDASAPPPTKRATRARK